MKKSRCMFLKTKDCNAEIGDAESPAENFRAATSGNRGAARADSGGRSELFRRRRRIDVVSAVVYNGPFLIGNKIRQQICQTRNKSLKHCSVT